MRCPSSLFFRCWPFPFTPPPDCSNRGHPAFHAALGLFSSRCSRGGEASSSVSSVTRLLGSARIGDGLMSAKRFGSAASWRTPVTESPVLTALLIGVARSAAWVLGARRRRVLEPQVRDSLSRDGPRRRSGSDSSIRSVSRRARRRGRRNRFPDGTLIGRSWAEGLQYFAARRIRLTQPRPAGA